MYLGKENSEKKKKNIETSTTKKIRKTKKHQNPCKRMALVKVVRRTRVGRVSRVGWQYNTGVTGHGMI